MKSVLAIAALVFSVNAFATDDQKVIDKPADGQVCAAPVDGMKGTISINFDGSTSYNDVWVMADGEFRRVYGDQQSATGLCTVWGKKFLSYTTDILAEDGQLVNVDEQGNYLGLVTGYTSSSFVKNVTCK